MFQKYTESIGLEIGDGLVKAMYIQSTPKANKLLGFEMVQVNFREGRQGIVNAMKEVLGRLLLKKKKQKINISVSGESVMVRDIHWPQMTDEEIRKALKFEVERQVHYKTDEIVFDYYSMVDKSIDETKTRVILVVAKKDLIENYANLIVEAGYSCGFVEVDTFSLLNCFYVNGPKISQEKTVAIINIGMEVTNIDIIKGKIIGLTKDAFVAWSNLIEAVPPEIELDFNNLGVLKGCSGSDDIYELSLFIMNALANQIRRTIEFYESQGRDTVEEIYLSGKVALYKNFDKYLQSILGLKVAIWDPLANVEYDSKLYEKHRLKENSLMMAISAGLACHRFFSIDLSTQKTATKKDKWVQLAVQYKVLLSVGVLVLFIMIGFWILLSSQILLKETTKQKLMLENQKFEETVREVEKLEQGRKLLSEHMAVTKVLLSRRIVWGKKLHEISVSVPEDVWLVELYVKKVEGRSEQSLAPQQNILAVLPGDSAAQNKAQENQDEILIIRGVAYSPVGDSMLALVNVFIGNLKKNQDFAGNFSNIELNRSYREIIQEKPVMKFEIQCLAK